MFVVRLPRRHTLTCRWVLPVCVSPEPRFPALARASSPEESAVV